MPALAHTTRAIARSWTAHQLPVAKAGCTALQTRNASASSFDSPFKIPSFAAYRSKGGETGPKVFQYFMVGSMGALSALGAKATVQGMTTLHRHSLHTDCRAWDLEKTGSWNLWHSNWLFCG
jgi:ubiquinol-cytochrome c reductase iron-sulfur subunit